MLTVEVELVSIHIKLNLGGFVNCMQWKHTGRARFDSMIGPFMTRVCSGLKVPHALFRKKKQKLCSCWMMQPRIKSNSFSPPSSPNMYTMIMLRFVNDVHGTNKIISLTLCILLLNLPIGASSCTASFYYSHLISGYISLSLPKA